MVQVYGVREEQVALKIALPDVSDDRYGLGEGDLSVNNLLIGVYKVFNSKGELETLCAEKSFQFWMKKAHPRAPLLSIKSLVGSHFIVVFQSCCPLLVMFPFMWKIFWRKICLKISRINKSIF